MICAATWVALLPVRSTRAVAASVPCGTGARKVPCSVRSGTSGTSVRIARSATAACSPPNTVRPCSQSGVMSRLARPGSTRSRANNAVQGVMPRRRT